MTEKCAFNQQPWDTPCPYPVVGSVYGLPACVHALAAHDRHLRQTAKREPTDGV